MASKGLSLSRGTSGSNPSPSSGESANFQFLKRCDCDGETRFIALAYGKFESSSLQRSVNKLSVPLKATPVVRSHDLFAVEGPWDEKAAAA